MTTLHHLLDGYSIEATAKDAAAFAEKPPLRPRPAAVFVPWLPDEADATRIAGCAAVRGAGLDPVPHLSARRIASHEALDTLLGALRAQAQIDTVFLIAGDIATPEGPFSDSLSVIETGLIERHGIRRVGIAGHPDGHPDVSEEVLWSAMKAKIAALEARGLQAEIVTQFAFDAQQVLRWIHALRGHGVTVPVRIGIPGPAGVRTLLRYAARCGVAASASVVAKYGLSLSRLIGSTGPDRFLADLAAGLDPAITGDVLLHIFPFGGFGKVAGWLDAFTGRADRAA